MFPAFAKNPALTPGFGSEFKKRSSALLHIARQPHYAREMLARYENYVSDPDGVVDAWGIPVLKIPTSSIRTTSERWRATQPRPAKILRAREPKSFQPGVA